MAGVAWAPDRGVAKVEVQVDEGAWAAAELSTPISDATWVQWVFAGTRRRRPPLRVRATDGTGDGADRNVTDRLPTERAATTPSASVVG